METGNSLVAHRIPKTASLQSPAQKHSPYLAESSDAAVARIGARWIDQARDVCRNACPCGVLSHPLRKKAETRTSRSRRLVAKVRRPQVTFHTGPFLLIVEPYESRLFLLTRNSFFLRHLGIVRPSECSCRAKDH